MEPDAVEIRVLGCLLEKQRTTPDAYPLSLNALRLACNQSTNRDPVVEYDEATVVEALRRLALRGWTRLASGAGSRARKYRHLLDDALGLDDGTLSLLAVLMLRGAQTPGELKQRSERLYGFADLAAAQEALETLVDRGYVERLERRPGQKEERFRQLVGGDDVTAGESMPPAGAPLSTAGEASAAPAAEAATASGQAPAPAVDTAQEAPPPTDPDRAHVPATASGTVPARLGQLERELAELRRQVRDLREALGETGEADGPAEPSA